MNTKVDIVYVLLPITLLFLIYVSFYMPKKQQVIVKEVVEETPAPYWSFAYPNYWEWPVRNNTFYDPYLSYPYSIGPWWYGSYGGGGYSGGIRTGGGGHRGGGHGGGGHGGGGGHHGGGGHGGGGHGGGGHGGH